MKDWFESSDVCRVIAAVSRRHSVRDLDQLVSSSVGQLISSSANQFVSESDRQGISSQFPVLITGREAITASCDTWRTLAAGSPSGPFATEKSTEHTDDRALWYTFLAISSWDRCEVIHTKK